ncbi:MAG: polysaccharide biosynthesis tyrosine autokinase [Pyrinomonadaceae bacterium]
MNKLNPYRQEADLAEAEYPYPIEFEGGYADGYSNVAGQSSEKDLIKGFLSTLRRHWFLILSLNLIITALTIVYVAQKPNYYEAEARIQVNAEINPAVGSNSGGPAPIIVSNTGADPAYFATQLQILEGSGLMRRVVKTLDLENNEEFLHPQRTRKMTAWQNVKQLFGFYRPPAPEKDDKKTEEKNNTLSLTKNDYTDSDEQVKKLAPYVNRLRGNLNIQPVQDSRTNVRETRLIDVQFTHQDPEVAAKIANAVSDAYVLQNLEQKIQGNASAGDFLQKRVAELQAEIRQGEERLINYAKYNQVIPLDPEQNTVVQRLGNLNAQLGQAENDRIAAQTAYQAALQNQMWTTTAEGKDAQVVSLESKLNDLRQKLAQLRLEYTDEWPEVKQTKEQITQIENQLKSLRQRASNTQLASLKEKLFEATEREKLLKENFEKQRAEVIRQSEASINYKIIQQEIDTNKSLLNGLLQRTKENEVILTGTPNNVMVLDRALVPNSPSGPERTRSIMLAFFASLGLGIGLAFLMDWFNDTISHAEDIEGSFGLPLLASIPAVPLSFGQKMFRNNLPMLRKKKNKRRVYDLEVFERPEFLESYMQLGAYLLLSNGGTPPQTVLITSAEEGEGKTLTALNLAASLAKTKGKILIIDADLRCPRIHKIKNLSNKVGLSTLLALNEIDHEAIAQTIQKDPTCNLDILTSGEHSINPGNLLSSREMAKLLEKLSGIYSHILIDSPPVLYFADSAIMSTLVDSVIIIVRDGLSGKEFVLKAKNVLQKVGAKIIGVVLNGVPVGQTNYYKYTHYQVNDLAQPNGGDQILRLR